MRCVDEQILGERLRVVLLRPRIVAALLCHDSEHVLEPRADECAVRTHDRRLGRALGGVELGLLRLAGIAEHVEL